MNRPRIKPSRYAYKPMLLKRGENSVTEMAEGLKIWEESIYIQIKGSHLMGKVLFPILLNLRMLEFLKFCSFYQILLCFGLQLC